VFSFAVCPGASALRHLQEEVESRSRGLFGPTRSGREHLVDLERSEPIYLVIRN